MLVDESAAVDILCRTSRMERESDKDLWPRLGMLSQLNNVYENPQLSQFNNVSDNPQLSQLNDVYENPQLPIEQRFWQSAAPNWRTFLTIRSCPNSKIVCLNISAHFNSAFRVPQIIIMGLCPLNRLTTTVVDYKDEREDDLYM